MDTETFFDLKGPLTIERKFMRTAIKSCLDECLNQLYVLRHLNIRNADSFDPFVIQYQTLEDRYTGQEDHAETRIPSSGQNQDKICHDISVFINILKESSHEIDNYGTFKILKHAIKDMKKMAYDEKINLENKDKNENLIKQLTIQCEEERIANKKIIDVKKEEIQKIKFDVENTIVYGRYTTGYYKSWEDARREQNNLVCQEKEDTHGEIIKEINDQIELEMKAHTEFENYIEEDKNDLLDQVNYWVKRYDEEIDEREKQMLNLKADLEATTDDLARVSYVYSARQKEIEKWMEYKKLKKEKEDRINFEIWAAGKIQSWWRGTMCRRGIPPGQLRKMGKEAKSKTGKSKKSKK